MMDNSFQIMFEHSMTNWWFRGKRMVVELILREITNGSKRKILDIGCGTGEIMAWLPKYGFAVGLDLSLEALGYSHLRGAPNLIQGDARFPPFDKESFEIILLLDILEHLDKDRESLSIYYQLLKKSGYLVVTVPALPSMWSKRDREIHHFRRYRKAELIEKLRSVGFKIKRITYRNFFLFFPAFLKYKIEKITGKEPKMEIDLVIPPKWLNKLLIGIIKFETFLLRYINLPIGSSLVCIAQK